MNISQTSINQTTDILRQRQIATAVKDQNWELMSEAKKHQVELEVNQFNQNNEAVRKIKQTMGKEEFLKLLLTQMKHQDPLEPVKSTDSVAQMAQFSALEQMRNVSEAVDQLGQRYAHVEANALLGKQVEYLNKIGEREQGTVAEVHYDDDGKIELKIQAPAGDDLISLTDIKKSWDKLSLAQATKIYSRQNN